MNHSKNAPLTKKIVMTSEKEALIELVFDLQLKLKKKNAELIRLREKLKNSRSRMMKMKDTVQYQRRRILELYPG
jgi:hypothetical protein